jgi:hypothetical protein
MSPNTPSTNETLTKPARYVVCNPNDFADQPTVRAAAWAAMKVARGHSVDLDSMAYILLDTHRAPVTAKTIADTREQIETALDETTPQNVPRQIRIKQRVSNHARTIGHTIAPHGGDAA